MALSDVSIIIDGSPISMRKKALVEQLTIELDEAGGPESAVLVIAQKVFTESPPFQSRLRVEYGGQVLFLGRLVQRGDALGDSLSWTLTYEGLVNELGDHRAFRRVYVDSDLDHWRSDQGPQTASNVWEVTAS